MAVRRIDPGVGVDELASLGPKIALWVLVRLLIDRGLVYLSCGMSSARLQYDLHPRPVKGGCAP